MTNENDSNNEETYNKIISFYDFAEELIDTVEHPEVNDPVSQLEFVEPLVQRIEEATDILSAEYREYIRTGDRPNFMARRKVAKALQTIYAALGQ